VALILNIDTSTETGSISLARMGNEFAKLFNANQKDHASWLHDAVHKILSEQSLNLGDLQAIAVTSGPGSYTGIRVGMASAKGLAYALQIPLITESILKVMAWSLRHALQAEPAAPLASGQMYCPMIDARRDEVFTAVYSASLEPVLPPIALKLDETAFASELQDGRIEFFGSGSDKWKSLCKHEHALFPDWDYAYFNLAYLSYQSYLAGSFADLAYAPADYLKEVYTYKRN